MASFAQAQKPVFNHIAIYVVDLKTSDAFYADVIGLDTIPEPFRDGKHKWFSIGGGHLHIIEGAKEVKQHPKNSHLCFSAASVDAFTQRLTQAAIPYEDVKGQPQSVTLRVDGVKQIYFKDPDGYWIEINDARN
jgi:lactoylglutathione lyase